MIISFSWTTDALLNRRKTVTRRSWKDDYAARFKPGMIVDAYDRSPRIGGKPVAKIRIVSITKELGSALLDDLAYAEREMILEGDLWGSVEEFLGALLPHETSYRVEFEVVSTVYDDQLELEVNER